METKTCTACEKPLPMTEEYFYRASNVKCGFHGRCRSCFKLENHRRYISDEEKLERAKKTARKYYEDNRDEVRTKARERWARYRLEVLTTLCKGTPKCQCCGETTIQFLAIDHINGGGNRHRREVVGGSGAYVYSWLKKNNYPDGFQVLCNNCNQAKSNYGKCPHEKLREGISDYEI